MIMGFTFEGCDSGRPKRETLAYREQIKGAVKKNFWLPTLQRTAAQLAASEKATEPEWHDHGSFCFCASQAWEG